MNGLKYTLLISFLSLLPSNAQVSNIFPDDANVGIGTITPREILEVNGNVLLTSHAASSLHPLSHSTSLRLMSSGYASDGRARYQNWKVQSAARSVWGSGDLIFSSNTDGAGYSERFRIRNDGNVGIGTTAPGSKLDIEQNHNGSTYVEITNTNAGNAARRGISIGNGMPGHSAYFLSTSPNYDAVSTWANSGVLGTDSQLLNGLVLRTASGKIRFQPNGIDDKVVFSENGNVGIGTPNPDAKLTVKGDIHAQEVKVDLNGAVAPDYVFKEDYDLRSLQEVQDHIKEHGHLPNIPSAKEMEANGIDLGQMNLKLLEKIEELTLYILEQELQLREVDKVKNKVIKQEIHLEKLERRIKEIENGKN